MKATDLSRVVTSEAIDITARRVMQRGNHWEPYITPGEVISPVPLPTRPLPPNIPDWTGKVIGKLTVIGLAEKRSKCAVWVCRCVCGYYCHRKTRVLRELAADRMQCAKCDRADQLRRYSGNWPDRKRDGSAYLATISEDACL